MAKSLMLNQKKPTQKKKNSGFALFELLITLACILFLSTCFITYNNVIIPLRLHTAAQHILAHLQRTHLRTQMYNTTATVSLQGESLFFTVAQKTSRYDLPASLSFGPPQNALGPPCNPKKILTQACTWKKEGDVHTITLHPQGPATPGTLYITDAAQKHGYAITTVPHKLSGFHVYEWKKGRWK